MEKEKWAGCVRYHPMMPGATYLYCVVRRAKTLSAGGVPPGLPQGTTPKAIAAGRSLWLIISEVPIEVYGPERLETALRDLDWVARIAVAHEGVVEHFFRQRDATVVPMKLFTMFSTEERAIAEMGARRADIEAALKRITGCEEWGVRIMRAVQRPQRVPQSIVRSGAAFLARRKELRDSARMALAEAAGVAADVFETLSPLAKDARRRDDFPPGATPPLLDAAFLVPADKRARFRTAARRTAKACADAGAAMTLTGPWPAYNFVQPSTERL